MMWISIKEKLPEAMGYYIVFRMENPFPTTRLYLGEGKFQSRATVTHWMPLPDQPKEES